MYIRDLHIRHMKLLGDFRLSFTREDGEPRMWTVIIGENGTGKTSILQAIALAAAGMAQVNSLAKPIVGHLRDRRATEDLSISATFGFPERARGLPEAHPLLTGPFPVSATLRSEVGLRADEINLEASSRYEGADAQSGDPLDRARARQLKHWFVAGYGVARALPEANRPVQLVQPAIERLSPLFDGSVGLTSTGFADYFSEASPEQKRANEFSRILKKALRTTRDLLPRIDDVELRGRGERLTDSLLERNRFIQEVGKQKLKVPAVALSHGYQSTIAWVADLVGHILLDAGDKLEPHEMEGLVLIDEIDLYLHPKWQVALVRALRQTFPKIQFVATTHSPLVLAGLVPEEIVRLGLDPETGDVVRIKVPSDPRLMTGTEIYRQYFGLDDIYPDPGMARLRDYHFLAANPFRTDGDEHKLERLRRELEKEGVDPRFTPVERIRE